MCKFYTSFGKRTFDVLASFIGLICLLPVFFIIAIAVKVTSKGPIFYVQERLGKNFRPFKMLKFRSMVVNNAQNHSLVTAKRDARITPLGSALRAYKLDELPQLWNVLVGDMSLVGPRPERPEFIADLSREVPHYLDRLQLKPGLTGIAQIVNGYDNNIESFKRKVAYDLLYLRNCSVMNDLKILLRTVRIVLTGKGAM